MVIHTSQLTALCEENWKADAKAFATVMRHIRQVDGQQHTVVMMQVENEAGIMPVEIPRRICGYVSHAYISAHRSIERST